MGVGSGWCIVCRIGESDVEVMDARTQIGLLIREDCACVDGGLLIGVEIRVNVGFVV